MGKSKEPSLDGRTGTKLGSSWWEVESSGHRRLLHRRPFLYRAGTGLAGAVTSLHN